MNAKLEDVEDSIYLSPMLSLSILEKLGKENSWFMMFFSADEKDLIFNQVDAVRQMKKMSQALITITCLLLMHSRIFPFVRVTPPNQKAVIWTT